MNNKLIGILAGMGPKSTGPFIDQVVEQCRDQYGAKDEIDFPPMMIYSIPTPFYVDRPPDHEAMKLAVCDGLKRLETTGVDFIAIPCNTVHMYYDVMAKSVSVPLLNIVDEALAAMPQSSRRIALLATRPTVESGIYQEGIRRRGLECVADPAWQPQVDELISVRSSEDPAVQRQRWSRLIAQLRSSALDTILIGCTDLIIADPRVCAGFAVIDTAHCLARAVVRTYLASAPHPRSLAGSPGVN